MSQTIDAAFAKCGTLYQQRRSPYESVFVAVTFAYQSNFTDPDDSTLGDIISANGSGYLLFNPQRELSSREGRGSLLLSPATLSGTFSAVFDFEVHHTGGLVTAPAVSVMIAAARPLPANVSPQISVHSTSVIMLNVQFPFSGSELPIQYTQVEPMPTGPTTNVTNLELGDATTVFVGPGGQIPPWSQ